MKIGIAIRRWMLVGAGALLFASHATAQTTSITRYIQSGQMDLMSVPVIVSGGNAISNIFPGLPSGSVFYFWDSTLGSWAPTYGSSKGWDSTGSRQVLPGEAFFLKPSGSYTAVLTGTPTTPPVTTNVLGWGHKGVFGYPYPVNIPWTDTQLASLLPPGSLVSFWDRTNSSFHNTFLKAPAAKGGGWGNAASNYIVHAGDGFAIINYSTNLTWSE